MLGTNVEFLQILHACIKSLKTLEDIDLVILDRVIMVRTTQAVRSLSNAFDLMPTCAVPRGWKMWWGRGRLTCGVGISVP
jgi:hypothetical protein